MKRKKNISKSSRQMYITKPFQRKEIITTPVSMEGENYQQQPQCFAVGLLGTGRVLPARQQQGEPVDGRLALHCVILVSD